jgi:hypothetical protein
MKSVLIGTCLLTSCLSAASWEAYIGPHFNYTSVEFNTPNEIKGYAGGVTAGIDLCCGCLFSSGLFEGTWNAGPITGTPCQRSDLMELFTELKVGGCFSYCCDTLWFKPYVGFGWDRYENEQDPKRASLCYTYEKLFVPVGFYLTQILCDCTSWGIQFEWRPDVHACLELLGHDLKIRCEHAFRVQSPIRFQSNSCCACLFWAEVVPFFDWSCFGKVKEKNSDGVELPIPALTRWNLGLRLLFGKDF